MREVTGVRGMRDVGNGAVEGEEIGEDEQAGLWKAIQEVITDLKNTIFH